MMVPDRHRTRQAFVFVLLTIIHLAAAVHTDHEHEAHEHEAGAHAAAYRRSTELRTCRTSPAGTTRLASCRGHRPLARDPGSPRSAHLAPVNDTRRRHSRRSYVKKTFLTMGLILAAGFVTPAFAQEAAGGADRHGGGAVVDHHGRLRAGHRRGVRRAARQGGQRGGRGHRPQPERGRRYPRRHDPGLVLIESLVIYVLLVAPILFFVYPFGGKPVQSSAVAGLRADPQGLARTHRTPVSL
jgi:hypothetical protein